MAQPQAADFRDRYCCSRITDLKVAQGASGQFSGLLNMYNILDLNGEVVDPGCFQEDLGQYGPERVMLWQHDTYLPIGKMQVKENTTGLPFEAQTLIDDDFPFGKATFACVKAGVIKAMSIGFTPAPDGIKFAPVAGGDPNQIVLHITKGRLFEGSEVTFPANEQALIDRVNARHSQGMQGYGQAMPGYPQGFLGFSQAPALSNFIQPRDLLVDYRQKAGKCEKCAKKSEHIKNAVAILDKILAYGTGDDEDPSGETDGNKSFLGASDQEYRILRGLQGLADSFEGGKA